MADCECLEGCLFFNEKMAPYPATAEKIKNSLCKGDSTECARYIVFQKFGKAQVPSDLYPDEVERAQKIISN